jgi:hypothetical protein
MELTLSRYYAVILRNLPQNCSQEEVKNFCESRVAGVLYALQPIKIKNSVCSIVVFRDLDDAENLCIALKKDHSSKNKKMKVHVDPRSSKIRRNNEKSHFSKILAKKGQVKFSEIMTQSTEMIARSVSFLKVFNKLYEKKGKEGFKENEEKKSHEGLKEDVKSPRTELKIKDASKSQSEIKTINICTNSQKDIRISQFSSSNLLVLLQSKSEHKTEEDKSKNNFTVTEKDEDSAKKTENQDNQVNKEQVENANDSNLVQKQNQGVVEELIESKEKNKTENEGNNQSYSNASALLMDNIISQAKEKEISTAPISVKTKNSEKNLQSSATPAHSSKSLKIGAGISNLGKALELLTKKGSKTPLISQQKQESNVNSSIVNTSIDQSMDIDSTANTTTNLVNQANLDNSTITPISNSNPCEEEISNIDSKAITPVVIELSEKEIQFYTYDFKDKNYYESVRQAKFTETEEKIRKREKSNFSNFSNAPLVDENKLNSIVNTSVSASVSASVIQLPTSTLTFSDQIQQNAINNNSSSLIQVVENNQPFTSNQIHSNLNKPGYGYQHNQNRKYNNYNQGQGQGNYQRNFNNKFQNNQKFNNYQNTSTSTSEPNNINMSTQNIPYNRHNHNYNQNQKTWPKKNYQNSYNKNQQNKPNFNQPTIVNNVNINMIQNSSSNPNSQPANIVNNIILPQSSIPPNITYQSITEITKEIVKPPEDDMLPPLPPDEPKILQPNPPEEKVEPGQILSDEEKLPQRKKRNYSPRSRSRSGSYSRQIRKKRQRSRSPYRRDHYDRERERERDRDYDYRRKDKYQSHSKRRSRSKSRSDSRSREGKRYKIKDKYKY